MYVILCVHYTLAFIYLSFGTNWRAQLHMVDMHQCRYMYITYCDLYPLIRCYEKCIHVHCVLMYDCCPTVNILLYTYTYIIMIT